MTKGFISIDGPNKCGKSTITTALINKLEEYGLDVIRAIDPGGTDIGSQIRSILKSESNVNMNDYTEALLFAASRQQLNHEVIKPNMTSKLVIADRYIDSTYAFQCMNRGIKKDLVDMANIDIVFPQLTFFIFRDSSLIDFNKEEDTEGDRIDRTTKHNKVVEGYRQLALEYPHRVISIENNGTVNDAVSQIFKTIINTPDSEKFKYQESVYSNYYKVLECKIMD